MMTPVVIVALLALILLLLRLVFDCIKPCARFAPLCHFLCLGIILGCVAGLTGEFAYDFIERWLFRNLPSPSLARLIDVIFDLGYARYLGIISGAAAAVWIWNVRPKGSGQAYTD
jgi:H+/Cl- antiporter ClcA